MTRPNPVNRSIFEPVISLLKSIITAAKGLSEPFQYAIFLVILLVIAAAIGAIVPANLVPLLYILVIGGFVVFVWVKRNEPKPPPNPAPSLTPLPLIAEPPLPDRDDLHRRYLHTLFGRCGTLSMATIDLRAQHSKTAQLALQSVFTTLDVTATEKEMERRARREASQDLLERENREPALTVISRHPRLVLLGQPGSGKSTLVNFITYCLAGEGLGDEVVNVSQLAELGWKLPAVLPLRVILREYAARGLPENQGLWAFLLSELEADGLGGYRQELERQLRQKTTLLLLDGLDEVPQAHQRREQLRQAIQVFARDFPQARVVITSRPYAYDADWALPGFQRVDLLDFNKEQQETYIDRWYTVASTLDSDLPSERAQRYAEQLKREAEDNPNLAELAPRPLLLALIVSLHRWHQGGGLPEKREELYDQSVDLLLDLWQRPKQMVDERNRPTREETSALVELGIGRDELRKALSKMAFEAHHKQPELTGTADIPGADLAQLLFDAPGRKKDISFDRIIEYVKDRAGLLQERGVDRQGRQIYTFPHRTFQEYLAACHLLAQETFPDELVKLTRKEPQRWRETVLLAAGRGGGKSQALVWQLVQALCPNPLPPDLQLVASADWWGAFLAGRVLWDVKLFQAGAPHLQETLVRVQTWLAALIAQAALPPRDRAAAAEVLDQLGWLPDDLNQWLPCPGCADGGGELRAMKYPITNAQYALFMRAGGYQQAVYWREGRTDAQEPRWWNDPRFGRERRVYPVVGVSWYEAAAYAAWLTELLRRTKQSPDSVNVEERALVADLLATGATEVRLPTETEWVRLAGGEAGERFPWDGNDQTTANEADVVERANVSELGWHRTTPVYAYPLAASQPFGLMDMAGNVWEWTASWYDSGQKQRVLRGGSWNYDHRDARVALRLWVDPLFRLRDFGFRVVSPIGSGS